MTIGANWHTFVYRVVFIFDMVIDRLKDLPLALNAIKKRINLES